MLPQPAWFTGYRPGQEDVIARALAAFEAGAKHVFLDAPTGTGKTLIGHDIARRMQVSRTIYACTTKSLQRQFMKDFPHAAMLMGRVNYPTLDFPERFRAGVQAESAWREPDILTADDCARTRPGECGECDGTVDEACPTHGTGGFDDDAQCSCLPHCLFCHPYARCPYQLARSRAHTSPLAVLNTALYLTEVNNVGRFSKAPFAILDECDTTEDALMGFVEFFVGAKTAARWRLDPPEKKTVAASWDHWKDAVAIPQLGELLSAVARPRDLRQAREKKRLERLLGQLQKIPSLATNWVYTGYDSGHIQLKPIRVDGMGKKYVWRHADRFLHMSATIISPEVYADSLGIPSSEYEYIPVPSIMPVERRPVVVRPVADMSRKVNERELLLGEIRSILNQHSTWSGLVHAVSYDLASFLSENLASPRVITYRSASDREHALERFRSTPGAVLISPSMDRGVDLPYDLCRFIIVAKVPFPDLSDHQTKARLFSSGGDAWYAVKVIRTLVQMTGRGMRAPDDWCVSYILDKQFATNLWRSKRRFMPSDWTDALDWSGGSRTLWRFNGNDVESA